MVIYQGWNDYPLRGAAVVRVDRESGSVGLTQSPEIPVRITLDTQLPSIAKCHCDPAPLGHYPIAIFQAQIYLLADTAGETYPGPAI